MIGMIKRFLGQNERTNSPSAEAAGSNHDIRIAVCALCIEIARIDNRFTRQELDALIATLKEKYDLSAEHAQALMDEADQALEDSVDLWQFARLINNNYTIAEKIAVIEMLWQIVYVDGKMHEQEHYLMGKLSTLLRLSHDQLIDAKRKALNAKP